MIRVEASTLQEAYSKAASELSCSVVDLDINIVQNGSNGFLGLFKKNAIIEVQRKGYHAPRKEQPSREAYHDTRESHEESPSDDYKERHKRSKNKRHRNRNRDSFKDENHTEKKNDSVATVQPQQPTPVATSDVKVEAKPSKEVRHSVSSSVIDQNFHQEKRDINDVLDEIRIHIKNLFKHSCFTLDTPVISKYDDDTVLIEFSGEDAALLIGKEGYRYKALSYLLYNWINLKYGLNIRLEIAEFLKNQEEMIEKYLTPVIERIKTTGKGQTKVLDGVLIKIALEVLRAQFPEKYVGIKSSKDGGKFIVVNDFNRKNA